jgi:hypothetical protein
VIVASADGERFGRASISLVEGQRARLDVALGDDPDLARRFATIAGVETPILDPATGGAP